MNIVKSNGKIITLYSFKGGVGRTMTVANIAFLAALNGRRVLVMDWDLEAPGLIYYFRGLLDPVNTKALRDAAGVMDFLWDWSETAKSARAAGDIEELTERYSTGKVFQDATYSLINHDYLTKGGCLDFIGAGRKIIGAEPSISYEEALARFSWSEFFNEGAGGYMLDCLKRWAKANYDLIFIDSRTGLADVSGICTMQLPDVVGMCFILNRQNIDGIARVSAAVRVKRENDVQLHAIPMRVSRSENPEESDARARATTELTRIGGFAAEVVQEDFRVMPVAASDNVPFYESLSPFYATDPTLDPLTLNYLRVANRLLGQQLEIPHFHPEMMEVAVRRLAPRNATIEYLNKLKSAEPARAVSELRRLLDSALDTEMDGGELDEEYVSLLIDVTFSIGEISEEYTDVLDLQTRSLDLVRAVTPSNPEKWWVTLTSLIQRHLDAFGGVLEPEEEHQLEEEVDSLLASRPTVINQLRRIGYKRVGARRYINLDEADAAKQVVGEFRALARDLGKAKSGLSLEQIDELLAAEVDALIIFGDAYGIANQSDRAIREYYSGLELLRSLDSNSPKSELTKLRHDLHFRLAGLLSGLGATKDAGLHAIAAINWGQNHAHVAVRFMDLASVALQIATSQPDLVVEFCSVLVDGTNAKKFHLAAYNSRITKNAVQFLNVILSLSGIICVSAGDRKAEILHGLAEITELVAKILLRRRRTIGERQNQEIAGILEDLSQVFASSNVDIGSFDSSIEWVRSVKSRKQKDVS